MRQEVVVVPLSVRQENFLFFPDVACGCDLQIPTWSGTICRSLLQIPPVASTHPFVCCKCTGAVGVTRFYDHILVVQQIPDIDTGSSSFITD